MAEKYSQIPKVDSRQIVDAAREVWMRRLIDFSRSNSLLFYRDLKVGTLDLTEKPDIVGRLLAGESVTIDSLVVNNRGEDSHDSAIRPRDGIPQKTRTALIALQRKALSNLEEKGIETLHLAMGLATWPADDGGRPYDSPVLLLPARIEMRGRVGNDLRLNVANEPQINPVLVHILEAIHGVKLDTDRILSDCDSRINGDEWGLDLDCVNMRVMNAASKLPGFHIRQRVILANFQFAKMAMVEDIKKNGDAMAGSIIVRAIAGHQESRRQMAEAVIEIEPTTIDERSPNDDFLVLDADSTQQRAIILVSKGQNVVVQGPPGTGKSQTIANLMAQSVADGRSVLFVAEKRAALEAVIKRLSHPDVGLGHLVLDLHGASVKRKEVMARLANTLEQIRHASQAENVTTVHHQFTERRVQLNQHAHHINVHREPTGISVYTMMGRLLRLPPEARSTLRLRGEVLAQITSEQAETIKQWIVESTAHPMLFLGIDLSPWNNAKIPDGQRAQESLDLARSVESQLWPVFEELFQKVLGQLNIRQPTTLAEVEIVLSVLKDASDVRAEYATEIFAESAADLETALEPASRGGAAAAWAFVSQPGYRDARRRLLSLRKNNGAAVATLLAEAHRIADIQKRWLALEPLFDTPTEIEEEAEIHKAFGDLSDALSALGAITESGSFYDIPIASVATRIRDLATDNRTPYLLPSVYAIREKIYGIGLSRLLDDYREHQVQDRFWSARFEYIWLYSALEQAFAEDSALASFNGRTHEQLVADFIQLDRERIRLAAQRVRRLHAERAIEAQNQHPEQTDLVRREAAKKSRHISLRELLARTSDVLTSIAPCWVASPLSVSQLLDGGARHFDIVIFDEASQVLQEEAVPALYRANQVVVAGDRHQLPPTTFFATVVEGEDDLGLEDEEQIEAMATASAAIGGFESLLDTLQTFLPNWMLEWHYRSEDERLISFSNTNIYDGRLVTFPSAHYWDAIRHSLVPHDPGLGGQGESSSREVDEVVRQVLVHAEQLPSESLGVITMGIKHANRVQAALDLALEQRPDLSRFFSLDREERFFVKNLETVQGDERDAIILSIGYGKLANGDLPHRFGPLTQEAGYRRLNVAVTRAKRRISVISSFSHHDVDLNRSGSRGVQLLKAYLEYANSGGQSMPVIETAGEVGLNPFEADIRDALEARGIRTRPQFGVSHYRIDLVAMHPTHPGRPVLAIECDGATYHSTATARDRDRLRQEHLQRLGWRFHRIWSTDWFYSREQELERAIRAFEDAVRRADKEDAESAANKKDTSQPPKKQRTNRQYENLSTRRRGRKPYIPGYPNIDHYTDEQLQTLAEWVASDGLLRTDDEMIREMFEVLPYRRLGKQIRARLLETVLAFRQTDRSRE